MFSLLLVGAVQLITQKGAMQCSWEVMHAPTQTQMWFEMEVGKWSGDHQFGCSLLFTMVILLQRFWETHPRSGSSAQFFQSKVVPWCFASIWPNPLASTSSLSSLSLVSDKRCFGLGCLHLGQTTLHLSGVYTSPNVSGPRSGWPVPQQTSSDNVKSKGR